MKMFWWFLILYLMFAAVLALFMMCAIDCGVHKIGYFYVDNKKVICYNIKNTKNLSQWDSIEGNHAEHS